MTAPTDVVELAARLMEIDSTSGREADVVDWLANYLAGNDWTVRRIPVTPGRDDVLATSGDAAHVTFSTHLDTVPPFIPPRVVGQRLCGRGACDAKGIAAAMIAAAERLRAGECPVALLFVVGEETTHDGAEAANRVANQSRILINGEPTGSTLAVGTKGAMRFELRTRGQAAHSAYPHLGRSAIRDLVALLAELETIALPHDQLLGDTTINVGMIRGGIADNVLAPEAEARLMARLVTPPEELESIIRRWVGDRAEVEIGITVPPVRLTTLPGFASSVAAYATDIPKLTAWGTPLLFGPGSIHVAHTDDEYVEIAELQASVSVYVELAKKAYPNGPNDRNAGRTNA
jgi:acetylornithine deacetylase